MDVPPLAFCLTTYTMPMTPPPHFLEHTASRGRSQAPWHGTGHGWVLHSEVTISPSCSSHGSPFPELILVRCHFFLLIPPPHFLEHTISVGFEGSVHLFLEQIRRQGRIHSTPPQYV